jgi:hydroxylamine dehydrogenase
MKKSFYIFVLTLFVSTNICLVFSQEGKQKSASLSISEETQECIDCHEAVTPGIVDDWLSSRHSLTTPEMALQKPSLERRVSNDKIPENLRTTVVGCYECHSLNADKHKDNFEHNGFSINVIVSPNDCSTCHSLEAEQYAHSKKANALGNLAENPVYTALVETVDGIQEIKDNTIIAHQASEITKGKTCYACHGTRIEVLGMKTLETDSDELEVPNLTNWPNQGVGRINPDGSKGACTSCHPRHSFSIEIARKPYTCAQCHLAPDVPAWDIYEESKHGNIFQSKQMDWNWNPVPWKIGKDFQAPTCATCHNSLLVNTVGEVVAERTHDFGSRLWIRIFGLIYSHPQPKNGSTPIIKNADNLPLPTTFSGDLASDYLIDKTEQAQRKNRMSAVCRSCHGTDWVNGHFVQLDTTIDEADKMVFAATQLMQKGWELGLADTKNPFDESLERKWVSQWLFYANSLRYSAAMGGPDYAAFKYGWWDLTKNVQEMKTAIELKSARGKNK